MATSWYGWVENYEEKNIRFIIARVLVLFLLNVKLFQVVSEGSQPLFILMERPVDPVFIGYRIQYPLGKHQLQRVVITSGKWQEAIGNLCDDIFLGH
jgi:hypothetical protein